MTFQDHVVNIGKITVDKSNHNTYPNYPLNTRLYALIGCIHQDDMSSTYAQIILDKDTLKKKMEAEEIAVTNLKLDSLGRLIEDASYNNLAKHIENEIRAASYVMDQQYFYEDRENYDYIDKVTGNYLSQHPDFDWDDLEELYEAVMKEIQDKGVKVYNFAFAIDQADNNILCASCNIKVVVKEAVSIIENNILEYKAACAGYDELELGNPPYFNNISEKYCLIDINSKNIKEVIDFILELDDCGCYDTNGLKFYLNSNLRNDLAQILSQKWTLDDELVKINGCIKAIEAQPGFECNPRQALENALKYDWSHGGDLSPQIRRNPVNETNEFHLKSRYAILKAISLFGEKDKSQLKYIGLHKIRIEPLKIEVEIQPDTIYIQTIKNTVLDSLFE